MMKAHKNFIFLFLASAFLFLTVLVGCVANIEGEETKVYTETTECSTNAQGGVDVVELEDWKELFPKYDLVMYKKPLKSVWELVCEVEPDSLITVAELTNIGSQPQYNVYVYHQKSIDGSGYNYYLGISEGSHLSDETSKLLVEVTEDTIDEIWLNIETSVFVYNNLIECVEEGELELKDVDWKNIFQSIDSDLEEYKEYGFVITEMVVAAAMDEEDWLNDVLMRLEKEIYPN